MNLRIAGQYALDAVKPDGSRRRLAAFDNLIVDTGLDQVGAGLMNLANARLGNGTAEPAAGDTALAGMLSNVPVDSVSYSAQQSVPYYGVSTARFIQTTAPGQQTYSEVGVAASSGSTLFSRALIRDQEGNAASVNVLADEVLEIAYRLLLVPPTAAATFQMTDSGTTYNCVMRAADVTDPDYWALPVDFTGGVPDMDATITTYTGALGDITGHPAASIGTYDIIADPYESGSHEVRFKALLSAGDSNHDDGIAAVKFNTPLGAYQISFDPPIEKDSDREVRLVLVVGWANAS